MTGGTIVVSGRRGVMMNAPGRIGCRGMAGLAGRTTTQPGGITQQRTTIGSSPPCPSTSSVCMAESATRIVYFSDDVGTGMAGIASASPYKISRIVGTMINGSIGMAVKTTRSAGSHDDIVHRGVACSDIDGPCRVVTFGAA